MSYVNHFVLIPDEEAFFTRQYLLSGILLPMTLGVYEIIVISIPIIPFWLLMFSLILKIFWIRAPFPFSVYSFLSHFSFSTVLIFVLLHCPWNLFLISFNFFLYVSFSIWISIFLWLTLMWSLNLTIFLVERTSHKGTYCKVGFVFAGLLLP